MLLPSMDMRWVSVSSQTTLDRPQQRVGSHFSFCKAPDMMDNFHAPGHSEVWGGDPSLLGVSNGKEFLMSTNG